jgi:alanine dehydrogenase
MRIGVPREIKPLEGRVGLVPEACGDLVQAGHELFLEAGAGVASGFTDESYHAVGVKTVPDAAALYGEAELVVKVKEPVEPELGLLRPDHLLFSFLHLAAEPTLTRRLLDIGLTAVAFETVQESGQLPVLAPMSNIAGRLAVQVGNTFLHRPRGGKGKLLGGLAGTERGRVVILGAGNAGGNAARMAAAMGAEVTVFDKDMQRLDAMRQLGHNVTALYAYREQMDQAISRADLLIGAILTPGAAAEHLVNADLVASMEEGSVIVDIAVDQGGCVETTRPTTWEEPTFSHSGVTHFGVTNMPGAVPRTASQALSAVLIPYVRQLASDGWETNPALKAGINVQAGRIVHPALPGFGG